VERHVVIIGGGFGGLYAARALARAPVRVTLVDRRNHHLFQPLLYQVASAGLNPSDIAYPIRAALRKQRNATVLLAEVTRIEPARRRVVLADGELDYDYLIVAAGATHSYFGRDEWEAHAPGLKTIEDALEIRRRMLFAFEAAERETDEARRQAWLTFVVVGGGPTGVELAGAIGELSRFTMDRDFRNIDPTQAKVLLLEGGSSILSSYDPKLRDSAVDQLASLGVEVRLQARVTGIDAGGVWLGGDRIAARTVVWAAGVKGSPLAQSLGAPLDRAGRVRVTPHLTLPGHDEVFVVGDMATLEQDGQPVPGVAPAAMQMGEYAANAIVAAIDGKHTEAFRYLDKGSMATIGRSRAILESGPVKLSGLLAWLGWLTIHIFYLIGFRNRALVLFQWAWAYLTFGRGARLITEAADHNVLDPPAAAPPVAEERRTG
jgi:NADH dehydrogenase